MKSAESALINDLANVPRLVSKWRKRAHLRIGRLLTRWNW